MNTLIQLSSKVFSQSPAVAGGRESVKRLGSWGRLSRLLLIGLLLVAPASFADDDHDHPPLIPSSSEAGKAAPTAPQGRGRAKAGGTFGRSHRPISGGCPVMPTALADFANGEQYDYSSMVTFLTAPECGQAVPALSQAAIASGVVFADKGAFKLDTYAKQLPKNPIESREKLDFALKQIIPPLLRQNPLPTADMLPLLGQLSLLSPSSARFALAKVIEQELYTADGLLLASPEKGKSVVATNLAATLVKLGAGQSLIANEMAESVEDMALLSQADSLAKYFRALAAAASQEPSLVPTFNLTAGALNRGVQRGKGSFAAGATHDLVASVFEAIRSSMAGAAATEPAAAELNEALGALLKGAPLTVKDLGRIWKEAIRVLALSATQTSLADVVASSLTPEFMFLKSDQQQYLMQAARHYPQIAGSVQATFLKSWNRMWNDLNLGRIPVGQFNRIKTQHFEPMTVAILELDPHEIDPQWLAEVVRRGMVKDSEIERRFPRFVLALLGRRDLASKAAGTEAGLELTVSSLAENFAVLWNLSQIHMPALNEWVRKNDKTN